MKDMDKFFKVLERNSPNKLDGSTFNVILTESQRDIRGLNRAFYVNTGVRGIKKTTYLMPASWLIDEF